MKPAPLRYHRATSLDDAVQALASDPDAKVLAGGQSLVPLLSMRLAAPSLLVDINRLDELAAIEASHDGVRVGALARHAQVLAHDEAKQIQPMLAKALAYVAHPTIRNRGTTVGSLVHADAAAEMPMVLTLLGGSVTVRGTGGERTIEAPDLFIGPLESTLAHDEIAVSAWFPALPADAGVAFDEIARRHGDYALCGVGVVVRREGDLLLEARVGFVSVSDLPTVVDLTADLAEGASADGITDESLAAAAATALTHLDPADDIHASAAYRAQLVRVLTARVVRAAWADAAARQAPPEGTEAGGVTR